MIGLRRLTAALAAPSLILLGSVAAHAVSSSPSASSPPTLTWLANGISLTSYHFGTLTSGTRSQSFTLANASKSASAALRVTFALSGSSAGFAKTSDNCNGTSLRPKASCTVTVQYAFTAVGQTDTATLSAASKNGKASASITLTGKSGRSRCNGPWTITPAQCLGNSGINFYTYTFADTGTQTFTLTNNSTTTMSAGWFARGMAGLDLISQHCGGTTLRPGQSCQLTFSFTEVSCSLDTGYAIWRFQGNGGVVQLADLSITGPCL